jgi:hypothetical protein
MKLDAVRRFALSLPECTESPHFDMASFRVAGKIFATLPPDQAHLHVFVDEPEVRAAVAEAPEAYEELRWGQRLAGLRVTVALADPERVHELLEDAWRRKAAKRLVAEFDRSRP